MLDMIMGWLQNIASWVFSLLPDSPFQNLLVNTSVQQVLGYVAYFVDIKFMLDTFSIWLTAIATYYIYMALLRWIKALGNT